MEKILLSAQAPTVTLLKKTSNSGNGSLYHFENILSINLVSTANAFKEEY